MIIDLINDIKQENIKSILMKKKFEDVICYPGSGCDVFPCVLTEMADLKRLKIEINAPLYIFCDPEFAQDGFWYGGFINRILGKKNLTKEQVEEICQDEGIYGSGWSAFKWIDELSRFEEIELKNGLKGYYEKIIVNKKECDILIFRCVIDDLWKILKKYRISVEGMFLWNWNASSEQLEESRFSAQQMLPKWILKNRNRAKNKTIKGAYQEYMYSKEDRDYLCSFRGVAEKDYSYESIAKYNI